MIKDVIFLPFFTGLSVGISCFFFCFPFLAPVVVAEARKKIENFFLILKFIFGRLVGYLSFGAFFGFLGEKLSQTFLSLIFLFALLVLSILLILYSFSLLKEKILLCQKIKKSSPKFPFLIGFFTGINLCPPFLISLTYVFTLHNFWAGIIYFFFFFLGTNFYIFPIYFLGFLNKIREFQLVARISGIVVGILFFIYGIYNFIEGVKISHLQ